MFSKTRQKMVLSMTAVLVVFLAVTLAVVYASSWFSALRQNTEMLERYISLYSLENPPGAQLPGDPPGMLFYPGEDVPGEDIPGGELPAGLPQGEPPAESEPVEGAIYQLSSFYSAAFSKDREVLSVDTGRNLYTEEEVTQIARSILEEGKTAGRRKHLIYRVDEQEAYTLVAFMDMTLTENSMGNVLLNTLGAGAAAIAVLTIFAALLSGKIIEPLEENDRRQKRFISDAGHELKTPVAVIDTNAELLEREIGENTWLTNIRYENKRMGNLVAGLLDLSRAESATAQKEILDFSLLAEREVLPFEGSAFERGLSIDCEIEKGIYVNGNPPQLCQLVSILADNAIRHSSGDEGGRIQVLLRREKKTAALAVGNPGEITADLQERIFDRFYRVDESRADAGASYGLGLSIARAIAESHGGKIEVSSGNGEVWFTVHLPLADAAGQTPSQKNC